MNQKLNTSKPPKTLLHFFQDLHIFKCLLFHYIPTLLCICQWIRINVYMSKHIYLYVSMCVRMCALYVCVPVYVVLWMTERIRVCVCICLLEHECTIISFHIYMDVLKCLRGCTQTCEPIYLRWRMSAFYFLALFLNAMNLLFLI